MPRFLFVVLLFVSFGLATGVAQPAGELPARPNPFRFVTDNGRLLSAADAQKLESGLRRYADNTGTQLVVVTVPTLAGRDVADYGRALGTAWGVGQREKDNGIVLLLSAKERQVTIQAGSGLRRQITPALTARVIEEQMTPSFKQGNYFAGLRAGLNTLMLAANPASDPRRTQPATASADAAPATSPTTSTDELRSPEPGAATEPAAEPFNPNASSATADVPSSTAGGIGWGTLLVGAAVVLGGIWLLTRLFRRRSPAPGTQGAAPTFYPNQPNPVQPTPSQPNGPMGNTGYGNRPQGPDFLGNRGGGIMGGGSGGGSGMGGVLLTGAAAAAGAYLGNRMATGSHDHADGTPLHSDSANPNLATGAGLGDTAAGGAATGGGFPFLNNPDASDEPAPDYFSDSADSSPDYFSSDDTSSYDDPDSGDTGGGGFDDDSSNSGSW